MIDPQNEGRRRFVGVLGLSAIGASLGSCQLLRRRWRYRYKLTAEVISKGKTYSGSSVIEVVREEAAASVGANTYGEATVVDVPGEAPLFFLLNGKLGFGNWAYTMPHYAFPNMGGMTNPDVLDHMVAMKGAVAVLTPEMYPKIVRFKDLRQPRTVELVVPRGTDQYISHDTYLREINIEMTDEPVTRKIISRLPWLFSIKGSLVKYERGKSLGEMPFGGSINDGDFVQGFTN